MDFNPNLATKRQRTNDSACVNINSSVLGQVDDTEEKNTVIGLLKKNSSAIDQTADTLGKTSDTRNMSTVIGLLKSINLVLSGE